VLPIAAWIRTRAEDARGTRGDEKRKQTLIWQSFGVSARRAAKALGWWLRGLGRPSPFFDNRTNAPRSVTRVLTRASAPPFERRAWETPSISTYSDLHSV
jgi:hypothetical protein